MHNDSPVLLGEGWDGSGATLLASRPRLGAERAGGLGESFAGKTVGVAGGRRDEQPAGEQVVA